MKHDRCSGHHPAAIAACYGLVAAAAVLWVLARGIRWDETWEHAQILAGAVAYPEGHPLALYVHNAFSFQTWLSGAMAGAGFGPAVVCGFRNLLFLLATALPLYLLVVALSRSALAGLAAVLLVLQGILLEFDGSYPTMVWPSIYSNGHIGGGAVLLALWALASGRLRTAFFLAGLLPAIHLGQWPPFAGTAAVLLAWLAFRQRMGDDPPRHGATPRACLGFGALGLGCAVLFWAVHRQSVRPMPDEGPFALREGATAVWQGYTALHDPHRAFPPGNGHVILLGAIVLCALGAAGGPGKEFRKPCAWLAVFCAGVGAAVWGAMALHLWFGTEMPFLLIAWMPYRLINLVPPIVLAVAVSAIHRRWPVRGWWFLAVALAVGLLQPIWPLVVGETLHARYIAGGEGVAFGLFGVAFFALAAKSGPGRVAAAALALVLVTPLAMYHQFGAICLVAGILVAFVFRRPDAASPRAARLARRCIGVMAALAAAGLVWHQFQHRQHLPVSPFQVEVRKALAGQRAMLAGPPDSILLQASTGQPVLAEAATPSLISYVPAIGPAIDRMYRDLYGYGFTAPDPGAAPPRPWTAVWRERSREEWRALAQRYSITHVIAPANIKIRLAPLVEAPDYTLYAINGE